MENGGLLPVQNEPLPARLAVMNFELVHDGENFALRAFDESLKEADEDRALECVPIDHPAHLALIGHRGDHAGGKASRRQPDHRRLSFGSITAPMPAVTAHARLPAASAATLRAAFGRLSRSARFIAPVDPGSSFPGLPSR